MTRTPNSDSQIVTWASEHVTVWAAKGTPPKIGLTIEQIVATPALVDDTTDKGDALKSAYVVHRRLNPPARSSSLGPKQIMCKWRATSIEHPRDSLRKPRDVKSCSTDSSIGRKASPLDHDVSIEQLQVFCTVAGQPETLAAFKRRLRAAGRTTK